MKAQYAVTSGDRCGSPFAYAVIDNQSRRCVFGASSESQAIAVAQRMNGFKPVDGNEQTFRSQVDEFLKVDRHIFIEERPAGSGRFSVIERPSNREIASNCTKERAEEIKARENVTSPA